MPLCPLLVLPEELYLPFQLPIHGGILSHLSDENKIMALWAGTHPWFPMVPNGANLLGLEWQEFPSGFSGVLLLTSLQALGSPADTDIKLVGVEWAEVPIFWHLEFKALLTSLESLWPKVLFPFLDRQTLSAPSRPHFSKQEIMSAEKGIENQSTLTTSRALFNESSFRSAVYLKYGGWHVVRVDYFWQSHNSECLLDKAVY